MFAIDLVIINTPASWDWDRGTDMLEFWVVESGVNKYTRTIDSLGSQAVLGFAFEQRNAGVLRWWTNHVTALGTRGGRWNWAFVEGMIEDGAFDVLDVCAEAEELGKVQFVEWNGGLPAQPVRVADRVVDLASQVGTVELLKQWVQRQQARGLAIIYTEAALDKCQSVPTLNWWASSGLQLKYSHLALHRATALCEIHVLDWWLAAYRQGIIPELKYNRQLIMTLASMDCRFDHSIHKHAPYAKTTTICDDPRLPRTVMASLDYDLDSSRAKSLRVLTWWTDSGLDWELQVDNVDPADLSCPSPIDVCMDVSALNWWLDRAKCLHSTSPKISSLQDHFPRYSRVAIHRAAYWNLTDVLDWWIDTAQPAGLQLRFLSHRVLELSAMTPWLRKVDFLIEFSSLAWCLRRLKSVQFRGRLLEWVAAAHNDKDGSDRERERAVKAVAQFCGDSKRAFDVESVGMPPPEGGYGCKEPGEENVFAFVQEMVAVQDLLPKLESE